jgi:hypothetical protein
MAAPGVSSTSSGSVAGTRRRDVRSDVEAVVWAVAGCLFEVSMPERDGASWQLASPPPGVTLLSESVRGTERHFRFRAEAEGAEAGEVALRFRSLTKERGRVLRMVVVRVAPEVDPGAA